MASPSVAPRARHTNSIDPDDVVAARTAALTDWGRRNGRMILIVAVVLGALAIGGVLYLRSQEERSAKAATELLQLEQSAAANTPIGARIRELEAFVARFDGAPEADAGRVLLGEAYLDAGVPKKALTVLEPVAGGSTPFAFQAAVLLGEAQHRSGDAGAAVQTLTRAGDAAKLNYQKQEALVQAAAVREQSGDFRGAAELYRKLVGLTEEGTGNRSIAEMRLAEVEHRATLK